MIDASKCHNVELLETPNQCAFSDKGVIKTTAEGLASETFGHRVMGKPEGTRKKGEKKEDYLERNREVKLV